MIAVVVRALIAVVACMLIGYVDARGLRSALRWVIHVGARRTQTTVPNVVVASDRAPACDGRVQPLDLFERREVRVGDAVGELLVTQCDIDYRAGDVPVLTLSGRFLGCRGADVVDKRNWRTATGGG